MLRKIAFLFILFVIHLAVFSQIDIEGFFPGAENHEIIFHGPADLVSLRQNILASGTINDTAGFSLSIQLQHRMPVTIEVGYYTYQFMAIPGKHYFLTSDSLKLDDVYRPFYNKESLPCQLSETPGKEINQILFTIDSDFNDFILANFGTIYQKRQAGIFGPLKANMKQKTDSLNDPFIKAYVDYKTARIEWAIFPQKKSWFFKTYIDNNPIRYHNPEYMEFIIDYFQNIPGQNNRFVKRDDLISGINYSGHYSALLDSLGKDTLLRNEQLRELVTLFTLKTLFGDPHYSRYQINLFLDQMHQGSKFEQHREIAANLKYELNDLLKGTAAKDFQLKALSGDNMTLHQLKGKPVYLGFFTTWSYACLAELDGMKKLFDKYGDRVHFISIILDQKQDVALKLKKEKNYAWPFLYNGTRYALLSDYRVKTFPSFILLDDKLNIVQYPAYKPSEVIEDEIRHLLTPGK